MRRSLRTFCLLSALSVSACSVSETAMNSQPTSPTDAAEAAGPDTAALAAKYRRNPAPKQPYRVLVKVAQAPGPLASVRGFAKYEAPDCEYIPNPVAGVVTHPMQALDLEFSRLDDTTYAATVYADALLDEDYLGKGVCHWQVASVAAELKASGAQADTAFLSNLAGDELRAHGTRTKYYDKAHYPRAGMDDFPDSGSPDPARFQPEQRAALFTISMTAEAGTP
ncbi:hypothetical protein [Lysobacter enzymogenes]|uniref:Lipoprotein n=1 Tax=Lysobacter enzymogenes TaxID=69 RepID=A0A3N2RMD2_LYSEN|nr:hypothetical protein [Lysobacter enzymogenes]ROU08603.1 hypothetical protein D9T17_03775 [Lysobacter enzymogenes]